MTFLATDKQGLIMLREKEARRELLQLLMDLAAENGKLTLIKAARKANADIFMENEQLLATATCMWRVDVARYLLNEKNTGASQRHNELFIEAIGHIGDKWAEIKTVQKMLQLYLDQGCDPFWDKGANLLRIVNNDSEQQMEIFDFCVAEIFRTEAWRTKDLQDLQKKAEQLATYIRNYDKKGFLKDSKPFLQSIERHALKAHHELLREKTKSMRARPAPLAKVNL